MTLNLREPCGFERMNGLSEWMCVDCNVMWHCWGAVLQYNYSSELADGKTTLLTPYTKLNLNLAHYKLIQANGSIVSFLQFMLDCTNQTRLMIYKQDREICAQHCANNVYISVCRPWQIRDIYYLLRLANIGELH